MIRTVALALAAVGLLTTAAAAGQRPQSYAGLQTRPVKALSEQQIADLRAGRGMGLALAAELNGYPGPAHVLELAGTLKLSATQHKTVAALHERMRTEAIALGERLIAQEAELDRLFATRAATLEGIAAATAAIGQTQGTLRATHLKYHLATLEVLQPAQVARYAELRGYVSRQPSHRHHH